MGRVALGLVEVLPATEVNLALDRLRTGDVRHRFVPDMTRGPVAEEAGAAGATHPG